MACLQFSLTTADLGHLDVSHKTRPSANTIAQGGSVSISEMSTSTLMMTKEGEGADCLSISFCRTVHNHRFMQRAVFPSSGRVLAFQDGGFCRYPSTGRRQQTGRPNARPRTGCITRRTYVLSIIFKVLRLVYYCASVGADFYSFSYRTSCDLVARDQNLSPLAQPGFWR